MLSFASSRSPLHDAALLALQLERGTPTRARRKNAWHSISAPAAENPHRRGSKHSQKSNTRPIASSHEPDQSHMLAAI